MSDPFIVKVQKSIANTYGHPTILVYDYSRQVEWEGEAPKDFKQKELKAYWWALIADNGKIELQGKPLKGNAEIEFEQFDFPAMNPPQTPKQQTRRSKT